MSRPDDTFRVKPNFISPDTRQVTGVPEAAPEPVELKLGRATSLKELIPEYAFYTPALLHLTVPLTFDPFDMFCDEYGQPVPRFTLRFNNPIFANLAHPAGDQTWNYVLFGIPIQHWRAYCDWLGICGFNDSSKGIFRRARIQHLSLRDPLALANGKEPEPIPISAIVIDSNKGSFYFLTGLDWKPYAYFDKGDICSQTKLFAEALNKGLTDPYGYLNEKRDNAHQDTSTGSAGV